MMSDEETALEVEAIKTQVHELSGVTLDRIEILRDSLRRRDWTSAAFELDRVERSVRKLRKEVRG